MLVSVVIPVFNTSPYLRECLDSVLSQTLNDFEVICVDDGSSDNSLAILREYEARDPRVKVVAFPENRGLCQARNVGMDTTSGDYTYLLDSDDWLEPTYLEELYTHAVSTGQDIVINKKWLFEYEDPSKRKEGEVSPFFKDEPSYYEPASVLANSFFPVVWCRLYKTSFLRENNLRFPDVKSAEDVYFTFLTEVLQPKSYIFSGSFYHFRQRSGSNTRRPSHMWDHVVAFRFLLDEFRRREIPPSAARRFAFWDVYLRFENEDQYNFAKAYFTDVLPDVKAAPWLYSVSDCYTMMSVLSSRNFKAFKRKNLFGMYWTYRIQLLLHLRWPSVKGILNGGWK